MKEVEGKENWASYSTRGHNTASKVLLKCKKQRSRFIRREVSNLIQSQLNFHYATEKIEKELQEKGKACLYSAPLTPHQKLNYIRGQESQKQQKIIQLFNSKKAERLKNLAQRCKQRQMLRKTMSANNFYRMSQVHKRYQEHLEKEAEKIEQLKNSLADEASRTSSRLQPRKIISNQSIVKKIVIVKQKQRKDESKKIESYLQKIQMIEERRIKKELGESKQKDIKRVIQKQKGPLTKRAELQQKIRNERKSEYDRKQSTFKKSRQLLDSKNLKQVRKKSALHNEIQQEVLQRKHEQEENSAQLRITMMQEKLAKIALVNRRNQERLNHSASSMEKNILKSKEDQQKEQHNQVMRQISGIIERLKNLKKDEQLRQRDINLLLENLDPNEDPQRYKMLVSYINSTKEKFMEQKRKEQEERAKRMKKNNQKVL